MNINSFARSAAAATLAIVGMLSAGCDSQFAPGGGGTGYVPTTVVGPVAGIGSITVNGVEFDDMKARYMTESGMQLSANDLRLGMMVEIYGLRNAEADLATADVVTVFPQTAGVVEGVGADLIIVGGLPVRLEPVTIYGDISSPQVGDFVEAYGVYDTTSNQVIATRIDRTTQRQPRFRGVVSAWNSATEQFLLGSRLFSYSGIDLPDGFADGVSLRVSASTLLEDGSRSISNLSLVQDLGGDDGEYVDIVGVIGSVVSNDRILVGEQAVNISDATFTDGAEDELAVGRRIEVEGLLENGVVEAIEIKFLDEFHSIDEELSGNFQVKGRVTEYSSAELFIVRNTRIDATFATDITNGTLTDLGVGVCIQIQGQFVTQQSGSILRAERIEFADDCALSPVVADVAPDQENTEPPAEVDQAPPTVPDPNTGDISFGEIRINGTVSAFASTANFIVASNLVDATTATRFDDGTREQLRNGACVEIRGELWQISSSFVVQAERVRFRDDCDNQSQTAEDDPISGSDSDISDSDNSTSEPGATIVDDDARVTGLIANYSSAQSFSVNNVRIDASSASRFDDGSISNLTNGACVEIRGTTFSTANGIVLIAERVKFESADQCGAQQPAPQQTAPTPAPAPAPTPAPDPQPAPEPESTVIDDDARVTGLIANYSSAQSFSVNNVHIDASSASRFDDGSISNLTNGACVEIRGTTFSTASGIVLIAERVKFEDQDDCE